ncbi:hypothetical protein PIROE2DRAFT_15739 [Piromyces sp. E2]|nr:hypothetical protein PIROE2DRAFT_15739 [Piromyces sp. E2]|eukprot:OUM58887.1 hypothetical protein PIROE2DRAFT_15739 [Piromyces sp. E2]
MYLKQTTEYLGLIINLNFENREKKNHSDNNSERRVNNPPAFYDTRKDLEGFLNRSTELRRENTSCYSKYKPMDHNRLYRDIINIESLTKRRSISDYFYNRRNESSFSNDVQHHSLAILKRIKIIESPTKVSKVCKIVE